MRYRGFEIASSYDSGVEHYNSAECRDVICAGYFCEIYPADDYQYADQLDIFWLAEGYEIPDTSYEALVSGIKKYIDDNYYGLQESKNEVKQKRSEELLSRLMCWLGENECGEELYHTLSKNIGMTDEEIRANRFLSLIPFFDREQYAQTIAEYLIDEGTANTYSGNYHFGYTEINERFGVALPVDDELLDMIVNHLDTNIVSDIITGENIDLMFYTQYCPNVEDEETELSGFTPQL